ncbi:MAG: RCC1-like domain-containing protein, partial [Actinomycetes bacterium]
GAVRLGDLLYQDLSLKNFLGSTHVVVDVLGYYSSGSVGGAEGVGSRYQTITPCRAVDTRFAPGGRIAAATTRLFQVAGERNAYAAQGTTAIGGCGVPDRAAAVTVAVTAVAPTGGGFARAYPAGGEPTGTFLNFSAARSMTNAGAVTLGVSGLRDLALSNYVAGSDFVVDVLGYYDANSFATVPTASSSISVGGSHSCRTAALGTVECWGNNGNGQLGSMRKGRNRSWPAPVLGLYGATSVDTGRDHTCALLTGGSVSCWGNNSAGELGDGGTDDRGTPANVLGLATAVSVATGGEHSCALLASRTVRCWGDNAYGQLGDGTSVQQNTPVTVLGLSNVAAIAAGEYYTCALLVDGSARCWGDNANGQLGDGTTTDRSAPTVVGGLTGATAISASNSDDVGVGGEFTCALVANGSVRCWGENSRGQLGDGTTTDRSVPTAVTSLSSATSISVGTSHACASLADGAVKCWGGNEAGTIGDATTTDRPTPTALAGIDTRTKVVEVSAGGRATCATFQTSLYLSPGSLSACWGSRTSGRLGTPGESGSSVSPTAVAASFGSSLIAVGANHTCSTGFLFSVLCWGQNDNGQLGDGTTTNRSSPTFVGTTAAIGLTAGQDHTCILRFDGSVLCWGDNLSGQLGIGTTVDQTEPSLVSTLPTAVASLPPSASVFWPLGRTVSIFLTASIWI